VMLSSRCCSRYESIFLKSDIVPPLKFMG